MPQKRDRESDTDSSANDCNGSLSTGLGSKLAGRAPIDRRGCLRLAGTALASTAAVAASGSASAKELVNASDVSGGTYDVSSGEEVRILVGENEYGNYGDLENALIDASSADVQIKSFGDGWKIQNVGVEGPTEGTNSVFNLKTDGGSGLVENVYLGDGGSDGQPGIFVKKEHSGSITIRDTYVGNFRDNGIYASTPGKSSGGGGSVDIESCYGEDNGIAHFRVGGSGSSVSDSVAVTTSQSKTSRGVWARRDDIDVENTDISLTASSSATSAIWATGGASVDYRNSDYETVYDFGDFEGDVDTSDVGNSPSTSPPSGVPTSAEAAAGGSASSTSSDADDSSGDEESTDGEESSEGSDDSDDEASSGEASSEANQEADGDESGDDLPNSVTVRSETGDNVQYAFSVEGDLEAEPSGDEVSGSSARGVLLSSSSEDAYDFAGEFTEFRYDGPVEIEVNGRTVYRDSES
jgi:hypothetical protein